MSKSLDKAIRLCDAVDDIYVRRSNEYYVNVKLGKSNPQISATISRILNKDKRVDGVLGSPGNWDVAIEGKDNAEYIKKILSGVGNISAGGSFKKEFPEGAFACVPYYVLGAAGSNAGYGAGAFSL